MKCFVILIAISLAYIGHASPIGLDIEESIPKDNSHYVEGESRYIWMPDGNGELHLVDLWQPGDDTENSRSGERNQYLLFTRKNPTGAQILVDGNVDTILSSNYDPNKPLKVIVHGWNSDVNSKVNHMVRDAFLTVLDCNVIVVGWRANSLYNIAVNRVTSVGQHLGNFLIWLINTAGGDWNNVHLVGFSLGAHIVGNAGRTAGYLPARITGLDPAGPQWGGNRNALNANDGKYVEAIHTNGGALGINDPIGRTNFYPNGGRGMPGCGIILLNTSCSHSRAYEYFASSVLTNHFVANRCTNLSQANRNNCDGDVLHMGNADIHKFGEGLYSLTTGSSWPF